MLQAYSPAGWPITGTADLVPACALATVFRDSPTGDLQVEFTGESKLFWDGQYQTCDDAGRELYQDSDGGEWPAEQLVFLDPADHDHDVQLAALRQAWEANAEARQAVPYEVGTPPAPVDPAREVLATIISELPWPITGIRQTWPHLADALEEAKALLGEQEVV